MLVRASNRNMGFSLSSITNDLVAAVKAPVTIGSDLLSSAVGSVGKVVGSVVGVANQTLVSSAQATGAALADVRPQAAPTPVLAPTVGSGLPILLGGAALALVLVLTLTRRPAPAPAPAVAP